VTDPCTQCACVRHSVMVSFGGSALEWQDAMRGWIPLPVTLALNAGVDANSPRLEERLMAQAIEAVLHLKPIHV